MTESRRKTCRKTGKHFRGFAFSYLPFPIKRKFRVSSRMSCVLELSLQFRPSTPNLWKIKILSRKGTENEKKPNSIRRSALKNKFSYGKNRFQRQKRVPAKSADLDEFFLWAWRCEFDLSGKKRKFLFAAKFFSSLLRQIKIKSWSVLCWRISMRSSTSFPWKSKIFLREEEQTFLRFYRRRHSRLLHFQSWALKIWTFESNF